MPEIGSHGCGDARCVANRQRDRMGRYTELICDGPHVHSPLGHAGGLGVALS